MRISAVINDNIIVYLTEFSAMRFNSNSSLKVQSSDLSYIKDVFESINTLDIFYGEQKVAEYTEYDGYSSIQYLGKVFCEPEQRFVDAMQVTLIKVSIAEQVDRIEKKVNNVIDFDSMTTEEYKQYLLGDISAMGEAEIFAGTNVVLSDGSSKIFTYDLKDQSNLNSAVFIAEKLDDPTMLFPYHEEGQECRLYPVIDILKIYINLKMMAVEVQTRVNMLKSYIRTINDKDILMTINYYTPLPSEYEAKYNAIMNASLQIMEDLKNKYFPED